MNFPFGTNGKFIILGVPILKHIMVHGALMIAEISASLCGFKDNAEIIFLVPIKTCCDPSVELSNEGSKLTLSLRNRKRGPG